MRISVLSSNKEIFNNANEEAIKETGHTEKFSCINHVCRVEASQNPVV